MARRLSSMCPPTCCLVLAVNRSICGPAQGGHSLALTTVFIAIHCTVRCGTGGRMGVEVRGRPSGRDVAASSNRNVRSAQVVQPSQLALLPRTEPTVGGGWRRSLVGLPYDSAASPSASLRWAQIRNAPARHMALSSGLIFSMRAFTCQKVKKVRWTTASSSGGGS
jgi:hypothetical protein